MSTSSPDPSPFFSFFLSKYSTISRISFSYFSGLLSSKTPPNPDMSSSLEERSSRDSVKTLLDRLVDRNAEAALRSSSRSDTVRREEARDLLDRPEGSQSDTVVDTEKIPDSQEPNLRRGGKGDWRPEDTPSRLSSCD